MKPLSYSLIAAALACGFASAQTTAYTTPVGYISLGNTTVGLPAVKGLSDALLTVPLDRTTEYAGLIASVANDNEITLQGTPAFPVDQWKASPTIVKITSGAKEGFYALVSTNTADKLTVELPPGQTLTGVVSGDKIVIQKAWTASAFFAGTVLPADTTTLYQYSGLSTGINVASDYNYIWDGTKWIDGASGEDADPIMYPGEMFVLRNESTNPITSIVVTGQVPTSGFTNVVKNFIAGLTGEQDLPFGVFSPIDQTIAQTGLTAIAQANDQINLYDREGDLIGLNKAPSTQIIYDPEAGWLDGSTGEPVGPLFVIKAGEGFVYRRSPNSPTVNWTFKPSYLPLP
jgi:uncharacterized protein (TIGR02597 family)